MGGGHSIRQLAAAAVFFLAAILGVAASVAAADDNGAASGGQVIEVWKGRRMMQLRQDDQVVRQFEVALGYSPTAQKRIRGDTRTPIGRYYVCSKKAESPFHRFLGISYPNVDDADRGYREHLISAREWAELFVTNLRYGTPTWRTALGGAIGIHGQGGQTRAGDWTKGCIAISDEEIEFLYDRVPVGTAVIINE